MKPLTIDTVPDERTRHEWQRAVMAAVAERGQPYFDRPENASYTLIIRFVHRRGANERGRRLPRGGAWLLESAIRDVSEALGAHVMRSRLQISWVHATREFGNTDGTFISWAVFPDDELELRADES